VPLGLRAHRAYYRSTGRKWFNRGKMFVRFVNSDPSPLRSIEFRVGLKSQTCLRRHVEVRHIAWRQNWHKDSIVRSGAIPGAGSSGGPRTAAPTVVSRSQCPCLACGASPPEFIGH
jgi:hypothetical protein